ncbi:hypothetical protein L6164_001124 [Bauhinia variegata]|uniref:Uncharacterized protein n=1 Tax=Bauhinia variegata TaxID=167791 RepID=A0ACB9Q8Q2_BAUVA|nr:hypothetical protein L6164_001124 [Bauhinia variegata]
MIMKYYFKKERKDKKTKDKSKASEIPFYFFNMSSIRVFRLHNNNLHGSLPQELCHYLPQLEIFDISYNYFDGNIPRQIDNCTLLKKLCLAENSFTGSIPKEIGVLSNLEMLQLFDNDLSGLIPRNIFNMSSLIYLYLNNNSLSGSLPKDMGCGLPNLKYLFLYENKLVGNIPNSISNASELNNLELNSNKFSGTIPSTLGNLRNLEFLQLEGNNFTTGAHTSELDFLTSLTNCRKLKYLILPNNSFYGKLPKSIGNFSTSLLYFDASFCKIDGNIPLELGNLSNLLDFKLEGNNLSGHIPKTINGLQNLQGMTLSDNALQGSIIDEICEIRSLNVLSLGGNKFSGMIPACLGNLTSLGYLYVDSNKLTSVIPSSLWSLKDILRVNLSSNALTGVLPYEIQNWRAITWMDLSRNQISGSIPTTIGGLQTLESLSLAHNKIEGPIPESLGEIVSLQGLDLAQNNLSGVIPKSLKLLRDLKFINLSYNRLEGEIPSGGPFKNFTAQSFMHNEALCGNPRLQVPPCREKTRHGLNLLWIKIVLPIILSTILVSFCIILLLWKRKLVGNPAQRELSTLGVPRRISYYELVKATSGFDESNLIGKGSFGSVYKGMLSNGMMVAVKVFNLSLEASSKSFDVECDAMCNLRHRNLVKLITSCFNDDFKALIMEFMPNGSIENWLYSHNNFLDFLQRLNIMIDVASALEYLHHSSPISVVHCDIKPSNILLDENKVAHVADFGIAKLLDEGQSKTHTNTLATLGYIAPEYGSKGTISIKGDVYSYGILMLEMFTRKRPTDDMFSAGLSLKNWVIDLMPQVTEILDSNLLQQEQQLFDDIKRYASTILKLGLNCCADLPEARISMTDVVASLNKIKMAFMHTAMEKATK